jgi:hypothetical protein
VSGIAWPRGNPANQGYCLTDEQLHELRFGIRFPTALCLPLVLTGFVLESPAILISLAAVGAIAGFGPRHPFDLVWNYGMRHALGGPELPPNPRRRRHAFKLGTALLLTGAGLLLAGLSVPALALGGALVVACASATVLNLCLPSEALAWWERHTTGKGAATSEEALTT